MIQIERDESLKAFELLDEGAKESLIKEPDGVPIDYACHQLVAIKAKDLGIPVNKFIISDKLLRELCDRRGWIK